MNKTIFVALILLLTGKAGYAQNDSLSKAARDSVVQLLITADTNDQKYRNAMDAVMEKYGATSKEMADLNDSMRVADSLNMLIVSGIIDTYGWLGPEDIGQQCNVTLFFVIQHATLYYQDKYLSLLRNAVKKGKARAKDLALLEDRVALKHGRPQIYGSQLIWNMKENNSVIAPLLDPDNVDKRRASVGLGPLSDYVAVLGVKWDVEKYKKDLPQLSADFFKKAEAKGN